MGNFDQSKAPPAGRERRDQIRVPVDMWVEELYANGVYFRRAANISTGGLYYARLCTLTRSVAGGGSDIVESSTIVWRDTAPDGAVATSGQLIQRAIEQLRLPEPTTAA